MPNIKSVLLLLFYILVILTIFLERVQPGQQAFPCGKIGAKNEERKSKTARKVAQVKERGGGGQARKETRKGIPEQGFRCCFANGLISRVQLRLWCRLHYIRVDTRRTCKKVGEPEEDQKLLGEGLSRNSETKQSGRAPRGRAGKQPKRLHNDGDDDDETHRDSWEGTKEKYGCLHESGKAFLAGNLDPELFCTCRGEGSRAFPNPYKALGWRMASSTVLT